MMYETGVVIGLVAIGVYVNWLHVSDRSIRADVSDEELRTAILHARQDIKLVAFLLGLIAFMLGVIADRIH
jgi:hypothetical protein